MIPCFFLYLLFWMWSYELLSRSFKVALGGRRHHLAHKHQHFIYVTGMHQKEWLNKIATKMIDGRYIMVYHGIPVYHPFPEPTYFPIRCWLPEKAIWKMFFDRNSQRFNRWVLLKGRNTSQGESNLILEALNIAKRNIFFARWDWEIESWVGRDVFSQISHPTKHSHFKSDPYWPSFLSLPLTRNWRHLWLTYWCNLWTTQDSHKTTRRKNKCARRSWHGGPLGFGSGENISVNRGSDVVPCSGAGRGWFTLNFLTFNSSSLDKLTDLLMSRQFSYRSQRP